MSFHALGLIDKLVTGIHELGYKEPTPIQTKTIPPILQKHDILASAQTGTGKTASFLLPVLQHLSTQPKIRHNRVRALILTPTRELAAQVYESITQYGRYVDLRYAVVFGGVKINPQMLKLRSGVDILVATPGRLLDLYQQNAINFDQLDTFILDEADRMLDMGFIHDIQRIIRLLPPKRQNLMFSATFSTDIRALAKKILTNPVEIDIAPRNISAAGIKQVIHPVDKSRKAALLCHLIQHHKWHQGLVFIRTKHGANKLAKQLCNEQIHSVAIHGNKSQAQRTKALADFKEGKVHILVATDLASRGLDIEKLPCVINYDLPQVAEDYVHRIGRTGRAGSEGIAISLVSADEIGLLVAIEKLMKQKVNRVEITDFEPLHHLPHTSAKAASNSSKSPAVNKRHQQSKNWGKKKSPKSEVSKR